MILFFTIFAIIGAIFVSQNKPLMANFIWAITNIAFIYHNISINQYEMAFLFAIYEIIAVYGIYNLWWLNNGK